MKTQLSRRNVRSLPVAQAPGSRILAQRRSAAIGTM